MSAARVVVVGAGFAGYNAARGLIRHAPSVEVVLINPTDYFLYLPLLPEVAAGVLEPRRICVSLPGQLPGVRLILGTVDTIDPAGQRVGWVDPEGRRGELGYDRLVVTAGSVNKLLPIPGVAENAHGFRGIAEALYLRDHITRQLELAARRLRSRRARRTVHVRGRRRGLHRYRGRRAGPAVHPTPCQPLPALRGQRIRWLLVDLAPRVLPELNPRLSRTATRVLLRRGVEVRTGQSVERAEPGTVRLTTGEDVPTRSLIWCVGVRPDPLVEQLGLGTNRGRLAVEDTLAVKGYPTMFAAGDCAAVADVTRPGELTGMTAQHAQRQGQPGRPQRRRVARGAASWRRTGIATSASWSTSAGRTRRPTRCTCRSPGLPAKAVTRGYHLLALPGNRTRTALDWAVNTVLPPRAVQLGLVGAERVRLECTETRHRSRPTEAAASRGGRCWRSRCHHRGDGAGDEREPDTGRVHSRAVAARELVAALGRPVRRARLPAGRAGLAGRTRHRRGRPQRARPDGRPRHRRGDRALREDHLRACRRGRS